VRGRPLRELMATTTEDRVVIRAGHAVERTRVVREPVNPTVPADKEVEHA
jgi:hypothetical protein